jgi:hypothetical protein
MRAYAPRNDPADDPTRPADQLRVEGDPPVRPVSQSVSPGPTQAEHTLAVIRIDDHEPRGQTGFVQICPCCLGGVQQIRDDTEAARGRACCSPRCLQFARVAIAPEVVDAVVDLDARDRDVRREPIAGPRHRIGYEPHRRGPARDNRLRNFRNQRLLTADSSPKPSASNVLETFLGHSRRRKRPCVPLAGHHRVPQR